MNIKKTACLIAVSLCLTIGTSVQAKTEFTSQRIWGANRYDTSIAVSRNGWNNTSEYAVIASGEDFSDALSAAPLAKKYNAPILLATKNNLDNQSDSNNLTAELSRLKVKKVFLIGGQGAVSLNVENEIKSKGIEVERIAGNDRYETSIQIATKIGTENGIVVTTGEDFRDALSMSPIAAAKSMPIILLPKDGMPEQVKAFINSNTISKTYVVADKNLVKDEVLKEFKNVDRILGEDEYERNINALGKFSKELHYDTVYLASRNGFADALSGAGLASLTSSPVILVGEKSPVAFTNFIKDKMDSISQVNILGGEGAVNTSLAQNVLPIGKSALTKASIKAQKITSMQSDSTIGLNVTAKGLPIAGQKMADEKIPMINNSKIALNIKTNGNLEKTLADVQEDIIMNVAGINVETTVWVTTDLSGNQPKIKEIVKIPAALKVYLPPEFAGKQYMVMDPMAMMTMPGAQVPDMNGLMNFSKNFQPQFQKFMEKYAEQWNPGFTFINYKGLTKISTKTGDKFAETYQLKLDDANFKAILNYTANDFVQNKEAASFIKQFMLSCIDLSAAPDKAVQKQAVEKMLNDMISNPEPAMKQIKFFMDNIKDLKVIGNKGIDITYYISDGYIIKETGIVDLQLDIHKFAEVANKLSNKGSEPIPADAKGTIGLGFSFNTENYNINKGLKIELPQLTKENSIDYMELIKLETGKDKQTIEIE